MRYPLFYLLVFVASCANTQTLFERLPYDHIWLFNGSRIDFNYDPPIISEDDQPMPFEGTNASVCDENGDLITYTNGIYISNSNGDTIPNGWGINDSLNIADWLDNGIIWPQHAITFYSPTSNTVAFLHGSTITTPTANEYGDRIFCLGLNHSTYNLSIDSLTTKNEVLIADTIDAGKISAVRGGDGSTWWVLTSEDYTNQYHKTSIDNNNTIQYHGTTGIGDSIRSGVGTAHFSPDGTKYAKLDLITLDKQILSIYDFDRCHGALSNPLHIDFDDLLFVGGIAFSENSRFLYVTAWRHIYQYDLFADDIEASREDIYYATDGWGYFMAQLAPDGKIYISHQGTAQDSIHVIHHPNRKGLACEFEQLGVPLPRNTFRTLPNYPYYGLGPWDGSPCDTLGIDNPNPIARYEYTPDTAALQVAFFDASHFAYNWLWDFGDGSNPTYVNAQHPVHTFPAQGAYEVCLQTSNVTGQDLYCETIYVGTVSTQEASLGDAAQRIRTTVYPNPVSAGPVTIEVRSTVKLGHQPLRLRIRDTHGREYYQTSFYPQGNTWRTTLAAQDWPTGIYYYEVLGEQGSLAAGKIVRQ